MTNFQKAYEQAEDEIKDKDIEKLKDYFKLILTKIEEQKKVKEGADEKLRILKLDLEDLKLGKIEKIKERYQLSPVAKSVLPLPSWAGDIMLCSYTTQPNWFNGTYNITTGGNIKTFYF